MKKDRFHKEMEEAYNMVDLPDEEKTKCKSFIVDNNNSYYEVDCVKYRELNRND